MTVDYSTRKLTGQCVRSGCGNACQEDHLLCEKCAEDHRGRNAKVMRRTRMFRKVQLWLIR
jgi:hypothetical protein